MFILLESFYMNYASRNFHSNWTAFKFKNSSNRLDLQIKFKYLKIHKLILISLV
jgi:hypothetical protein